MACVFHWIWIPFCWYSGFTAVTIIPFHSFSMATTQGQVITCKGSLSLFSLFTIKAYLLSLSLCYYHLHVNHWNVPFSWWSRGGLGTQQAIVHRGRSGGAAAEWRGPYPNSLHCFLSHRRLHLERQVTYLHYTHSFVPIFWFHLSLFFLLLWLVFSVSGYNTWSAI